MLSPLFSTVRLLATAALWLDAITAGAQEATLKVGHFPNITHAQALVAAQLTRQGRGWFESRLGVKVQWFSYNAGPSAMEGIAANSIDLAYVGPNPALNLYTKAQGDEVRIVAGSAEGGAALVVQPDGRIKTPADFRGRAVATPQMGNTQDVACRAWLTKQGFRVTQVGGDVKVLPVANPDQLGLFSSKQIDAVWTVEPWVSRLEMDAQGQVFLEQKDSIATVVVSSVRLLEEKPELVRKFVAAHAELTRWINEHPDEAKKLVNAELKAITKREMPPALIDRAWSRMRFTSELKRDAIAGLVAEAQSAGFLRHLTDISRLLAIPQ